jgi:hypothetical protein
LYRYALVALIMFPLSLAGNGATDDLAEEMKLALAAVAALAAILATTTIGNAMAFP